MSNDLVATLARQIIDELAPLIPAGRPVALVGFRGDSNCDDHAMWLGEKRLISRLGLDAVYECSIHSYDREALAAKLGNGTILLHGAGSRGRDRLDAEFRSKLVKDFPSNRIVLRPRSGRDLESMATLLGARADALILAGGTDAKQAMERQLGAKARIVLAPDAALLLDRGPRSTLPVYDMLWLARTDEEETSAQTEAAARLSSQPPHKFVLPRFDDGIEIGIAVKDRPPTVLLTDWNSLFFESQETRLAMGALSFDAQAEVYLRRARHVIALGHVVITDRLHGHILSLLSGIPHVLVDTPSGENGDFYRTWTKASPLCRLARNPAEGWTLARSIVAELKGSEIGHTG